MNRPHWLLVGTALFAMAWAVTRASYQSITIDEASTFLGYVVQANTQHWYPNSNNHVLNTALMRLFTTLFGVSNLTVRIPALIGAALYIAAVFRLCLLLSRSLVVQWPLFVCLVYNPFIFDYMVAARGYGLALAFVMWTMVYPAAYKSRSLAATCAVSSACAALSFVANFSFAFVDAAALAAVLWMALRSRGLQEDPRRLLAATLIPALAVSIALTGWTVFHWSSDLIIGAATWKESFASIIGSSQFQLNSDLVNPWMYAIFKIVRETMFPLLVVAALGSAVALRKRSGKLWLFAGGAFGVLVATLLLHWIAHLFFGLLLPKERTALFIFPLFLMAIGAIAAIPAVSRIERFWSGFLTTVLFAMAAFNVLCLRLGYFKEWQWDADVQRVYAVLACLNHAGDAENIASQWYYAAPLEYYRVASAKETLTIHVDDDPAAKDAPVYIVNSVFGQQTIHEHGLKVVYKGPTTDVVIAVVPELEEKIRSAACPIAR